jgi:hypothetical protein
MKKIIFIITFIIISFFKLKAQQRPDTVFFNKDWVNTIRDSAAFYRIRIIENKGIKVADYYLNGTLQMSGFYKSLNPDKKHGLFKYYSNEGNLISEGNYKSNKENGEWKTYNSLG